MTSKFWYLVGHYLKKRVGTKSFIIVNVILFLLIVVAANIPTIITKVGGDFDEPETVYVNTAPESDYVLDYLQDNDFITTLSPSSNFIFEKIDSFSKDEVSTLLKDSTYVIDIIATDTSFKANVYSTKENLTDQVSINSILTGIKQTVLFNNLTDEEKTKYVDIQTPVSVVYTTDIENGKDTTSQILGALSIFIIAPIFFFLIMIMTFVGTSIIDEKSSRAIEIIITNVTPIQHFFSKILSAIFYVLIEVVIMGLAGVIGAVIMLSLTGQSSISGALINAAGGGSQDSSAISTVISSIVSKMPVLTVAIIAFILLGFTFYLILIALAAAMSNTQEDFQQFQSPVMILLLVGLYTGIFGLLYNGSQFVSVMAFIPFFSPLLAPSLFLTGDFGGVQILISALILLASDGLLLYFGLPMYKTALLSNSDAKFFKRVKRIFKGRKN